MHVFPVSVAVEGIADSAAVERLAEVLGVSIGHVYVAGSKQRLDRSLPGYNAAARRYPWLVLRDLDVDADCAPALLPNLLQDRSKLLRLRLAVRSLESWLLADRENLASFLSVSLDLVTSQPEEIENPKLELVSLARRSRSRTIRRDMVPEDGLSAKVGSGYNAHLIEFITERWQPEQASRRSDSLARCLRVMREIATQEA